MINETDLAYLAGFFDGEGCIQINKTNSELMKRYNKSARYYLMISANQVFSNPILKLRKVFGGTIYVRPNLRPLGVWRLQGKRAASALTQMLPYLDVKKDEAILAIEFQSLFFTVRNSKLTEEDFQIREEYKQKMHIFKHRNGKWNDFKNNII